MKRQSKGARWLIAALALSAMGAVSCSGTPEREDRIEALRVTDPLPKSIRIQVTCGQDPSNPDSSVLTYGDEGDWERYFAGVLEDLGVSARVWAAVDDGALHLTEEDADVTLRIEIRTKTKPGQPKVDPAGAVLDVATWLFIPFLPLFVEDVSNDPGIEVDIDLAHLPTEPISPDPVDTNMLDRYPIFSWPTLSVLVVPPWVYGTGDSKHLARSIKEAVRRQVVLDLAEFVKVNAVRDDELMEQVQLERDVDGWVLSFKTREDTPLSMITLRVAEEEWSELLSPDERVHTVEIRDGELNGGEFLQVKPQPTRGDGSDSYTLRIPASLNLEPPLTAKAPRP